MEVNYLNLKKMYNHILLNVPEEMIRMDFYREKGFCSVHQCESVGCVIGHCVILDDWANVPFKDDSINFDDWSEEFTGISSISEIWSFCFSSIWPNNKEQILLRLKFLIDNQTIPFEFKGFNKYDIKLPLLELTPYVL